MIKFIQQQFFSDLLRGRIKSREEIDNRIKLAKLNLKPSITKCGIFDCSMQNINEFMIDKWRNYERNFKEILQDFINIDRNDIIYFSVFEGNSQFKIIALSDKYDNMKQMKMEIKNNIEEMMRYIDKALGLKIVFFLKHFYNSIYRIIQDNRLLNITSKFSDNNYNLDNDKEFSCIIIEKAIEYIRDNYQKDISRNDVAEYVFLNPSYFSRLFKQQTGINFSDYLTKVRIEKAVELLNCKKYKIYEVGKKVGIKDQKYFSKVFKKYTGYTPTKYLRSKIEG